LFLGPGSWLICKIITSIGNNYRSTIKISKLNQIITTSDGSHTLYVPELDEHYHSIHGAVQESEHIFLRAGYDYCKADPLNIFEAGFGTGLNALLTAMRSRDDKRAVFYTAIEKYPVERKVINKLNHFRFAGAGGKEISDLINSSPWGEMCKINDKFSLKKIKGDLITHKLSGPYDLIYFDAFGPDKQPEMWTRELFSKIYDTTKTEGIIVTYSAKGDVKRNLQAIGFNITLLSGPPGKRHIIRGIKI
jgi:tRNA U34 5-methylaminomethyl-2-thiouridine-forming methyltransferase MnmC